MYRHITLIFSLWQSSKFLQQFQLCAPCFIVIHLLYRIMDTIETFNFLKNFSYNTFVYIHFLSQPFPGVLPSRPTQLGVLSLSIKKLINTNNIHGLFFFWLVFLLLIKLISFWKKEHEAFPGWSVVDISQQVSLQWTSWLRGGLCAHFPFFIMTF